jgi:hypothetical protein
MLKFKNIKYKSFKLEKLYLDCIDDQGNCFIIYWAKAEFFFIRFGYSGLIFCDADGNTIEKSVFGRTLKPSIGESINFSNKTLKVEATLRRTDNTIFSSLYKDKNNKILDWNCHHPKAITEISLDGKTYKGSGYAETLLTTVKPWNLPIDELRWGRYLSDSTTVIWINWKGKHTLNKIFLNGIEYNDAVFENDKITFCNGSCQLKFLGVQVIRKNRLSGIFLKVPLLRMFLKKSILNTLEIKYKAKTEFSKNSVELSTGWSLYEVVIWGK